MAAQSNHQHWLEQFKGKAQGSGLFCFVFSYKDSTIFLPLLFKKECILLVLTNFSIVNCYMPTVLQFSQITPVLLHLF